MRTERKKKCFFNTSFLGVCVLFLLCRSQFIHFAPFIALCTLRLTFCDFNPFVCLCISVYSSSIGTCFLFFFAFYIQKESLKFFATFFIMFVLLDMNERATIGKKPKIKWVGLLISCFSHSAHVKNVRCFFFSSCLCFNVRRVRAEVKHRTP